MKIIRRRQKITLKSTVIIAALCLSSRIFAASIDCSKKNTELETEICNDYELSKLDKEVDQYYRLALGKVKDKAGFIEAQRVWLKTERDKCEYTYCVEEAYKSRRDDLKLAAFFGVDLWKESESERGARIRNILRHNRPLRRNYGEPQFCDSFFNALQNPYGEVKYIEPEIKTNNSEHNMIYRYRTCDVAQERFDVVAQKAFRIYKIPLEGEGNRSRELLYNEVNWNKVVGVGGAGYIEMDLDACSAIGAVPVDQALRPEGRVLDNASALISYRQGTYVLRLTDLRGTRDTHSFYMAELWYLGDRNKVSMPCSWRWQSTQSSMP